MKTEWLQVRLTPSQKASLRRRARAAGMDLSAYVISRVVPAAGEKFGTLVAGLADSADRRLALADLHDLLADLGPAEFASLDPGPRLAVLSDEDRNRVAAMVEHAAARRGAAPPPWVRAVPPLETPRFATDLRGLRAHLLRTSPVAFRRRNLFVDATVGDRA